MTEKRAIYRQNDGPPLAGVFEHVFQRVSTATNDETRWILAAFAISLVDGEAFDLSMIETLPDEADRLLCRALFEYCLTEGLTEDERQAASVAFVPFAAMHAPGTRH